jgi:hypothetical protein
MGNKTTEMMGVTFSGPVTFNGPMFDIHDNEHVHMHVSGQPQQAADEGYEYVDFVFFADKRLTTLEEQNVLRRVLKGVLSRMDVDSGRDWVAPYIAYHYFIGREFLMKGYVDFFTDIEGLLPGVLTKVNADETGDKRYKAYTDLLRAECANWFILDDCLPPMQVWSSNQFTYHVDDTRRKRIQGIVKDIYQGLQKGI